MLFNNFICIKQTDKNDCGFACIATILKKYKIDFNIFELKEKCKLSSNGMKVKNIKNIFNQYNFSTKIFKATSDDELFKNNNFPFITSIVVDNSYTHFIVVYKITKKYIIFSDPATKIEKMLIRDFLLMWTGLILFPYPQNAINISTKDKETLCFFKKIIKHNKRILLVIFLISLIISFINIFSALYIKFIFNYIIPNNLKNSLTIFSIGLIILIISSNILSGIRETFMLYFSRKVDTSFILPYYKKIISLPIIFFQTKSTGDIISRLQDAYKIRSAILNITMTIIIDVFMCIIGGVALLMQSEYMFLIILIPIILYIISILVFKKTIDKINKRTMKSQASLITYMNQSINSIETIKAFNLQEKTKYMIENKFVDYIANIFKVGYINNIQTTINKVIKGSFIIIILWYGTYEVLNKNISAGSLLAFNSLLAYFLTPILNIVKLQNSMQSAQVALYRLKEITYIGNDTYDEANKITKADLNGDIVFKDVKFSYNNSKLVLNSINFSIKKGKNIALVGESGSGKTTLVKILLKFYKLELGDIKISNYSIKDLSSTLIRSKIAYVSQDVYLFYGTIFDNIVLGNKKIEFSEVINICENLGLSKFINSLPCKYNTIIEEGGKNLSGGQKQRLALARAILSNPNILIFDEITSNLDSINEEIVNAFIKKFLKEKTIFIITHRFSTIKICDEIVVLNNGRIEEIGSHNELINIKGHYYNLFNKIYNNQ